MAETFRWHREDRGIPEEAVKHLKRYTTLRRGLSRILNQRRWGEIYAETGRTSI